MGERPELLERVRALAERGEPERARQVLSGGLGEGCAPERLELYARLLIRLGRSRDAAPYLLACGAREAGDVELVDAFLRSVDRLPLLEFTSRLPAGVRWRALDAYPERLAGELRERGYRGPADRPPSRSWRDKGQHDIGCCCGIILLGLSVFAANRIWDRLF